MRLPWWGSEVRALKTSTPEPELPRRSLPSDSWWGPRKVPGSWTPPTLVWLSLTAFSSSGDADPRSPAPPTHTPPPRAESKLLLHAPGCFSPQIFCGSRHGNQEPSCTLFPQDTGWGGVGGWDGETTRLLKQGPFYPTPPPSFGPPPHHWAWSSLGPQRPGCLSGWVAGLRFPPGSLISLRKVLHLARGLRL